VVGTWTDGIERDTERERERKRERERDTHRETQRESERFNLLLTIRSCKCMLLPVSRNELSGVCLVSEGYVQLSAERKE
jgi:hypothetical protein